MSRPAPERRDTEALFAEVRAVYSELEERPIERFCEGRTDCCRFKLTGQTPYLTRGEAYVAARAYRSMGKGEIPVKKDGSCPMLVEGTAKCQIYEDRPFACRTHFCEAAGGPYARRDVVDLIRRLEAVDEKWDGRGPQKIEVAIGYALRNLPRSANR
jgi:Fe-S-cluster containining protein